MSVTCHRLRRVNEDRLDISRTRVRYPAAPPKSWILEGIHHFVVEGERTRGQSRNPFRPQKRLGYPGPFRFCVRMNPLFDASKEADHVDLERDVDRAQNGKGLPVGTIFRKR